MDAPLPYLLVVEDDPDIRNLLDTTLQFRGYRVVTARNGREALDHIKQEHPILIIADIMMPELDGFGMAHRLRIDPETCDIPVVFITATFIASEDREFALSLGAARFIRKPIDFDKFLATVEELLEERSSAGLPPIHEASFYSGYRKRLERKLEQKQAEILRDEQIVRSNPFKIDPRLDASLRLARNERSEILLLIEQIDRQMKDSSQPQD